MCRNVTYVIFLFFAKYRLVALMLKSNAYNENVFEIHGATDTYSFAIVPKTLQCMPIWILLEESS